MHRNAISRVKVNGTFRDDFWVQVGLHQSQGLSSLLFMIMLEALSGKIRSGWPEGRLYSDDMAFVIEMFEGLMGRLEAL